MGFLSQKKSWIYLFKLLLQKIHQQFKEEMWEAEFLYASEK